MVIHKAIGKIERLLHIPINQDSKRIMTSLFGLLDYLLRISSGHPGVPCGDLQHLDRPYDPSVDNVLLLIYFFLCHDRKPHCHSYSPIARLFASFLLPLAKIGYTTTDFFHV